MIDNRRLTAWLRPFVGFLTLVGILALSACGGGNGAPNNPFAPIPVTIQLTVLPSSPTIYAKVPSALTISGGSPPYRAFSSNTVVLPVVLSVPDNTVSLLASPVTTTTTVTITIQDSAGQSVLVPVTVQPELVTPPPALVVLPSPVDVFSGTATSVTIVGGVAPYRAFSSNSAILPVTQAVTGNTVSLLAGNVTSNTPVVLTIQDAVGQTVVVNVTVHPTLATPPPPLTVLPSAVDAFSGSATQLTVSGGVAPYQAFSSNSALLPVVQTVSGNTITLLPAPVAANTLVNVTVRDSVGQTVVVPVTVHPQFVSPPPALVVLPDTIDVFPGIPAPLTISGGVAPYRAFSTNPTVLPVATNVSGTVINLIAANVTLDTRIVVTIQDAAGQTKAVDVTVHPTPTTPAGPLVVLPTNIVTSKGVPFTLTITGGLAPYKAYSTNPGALPVTQSVTGSSLTLTANGVSTDTTVTVTIQDSAGQTVNVNVLVKADSATPPPPLTIFPPSSVVFSGVPATLTVSGGTPPYTAFSSNSAVLPVTQAVTGNLIPLFAANVNADTPVTITVQDADNKTASATVTVRAAPLLNTLTVTPNRADCGVTAVCSGQTAIAAVTVSAPGGGGIPNRQVRFDVVTGDYLIQNGTALVSSQTTTSDQAGFARVVLLASVNAPTQVALIRATDLTSGNQVTASFVIAQFTNGSAILSVLPGAVTVSGTGTCPNGLPVDYYVFGGTPPYRVVASLPTLVNLSGSPVGANGGSFRATTNGCVDLETFIVTDATGRTVTATLSVVTGGSGGGGGGGGGGGTSGNCAGFSPPNPGCPNVNPPSLTISACPTVAGYTQSAALSNATAVPAIVSGTGVTTIGSTASTLVVSRTSGIASSTAIARVFAGALFVDVPITITNASTNCP